MNENCSDQILSEEYLDFITDYELASKEVLDNMRVCNIRIDSSFASLYMPVQIIPGNVMDRYGYKVFVRLFGLLDLTSLEASGVTKLKTVPGLNLSGEGVLVGFVDTGIDYTHKAFLNSDGTTKITSIWDQTIQSENFPEGLPYGTEFTREEINMALQNSDPATIVPSVDEIGHGTYMAGIATGNVDLENNFSGVVPNAELVVVKLKPAKQNLRNLYLVPKEAICYQENDIMMGVKYLVEVARKLNRPISICIGLGTSQGAHDINSFLTMYLTSLTQRDGVAVIIAAGNEGNSRHHYEKNMRTGTDVDVVELNVGKNEQGFVMEIWGNPPNTFGIEMMTPTGEYVSKMIPRLGEQRELSFIFETSVVNIFFKLVGSRSGAQLVMIRFQNPTEGTWRITIHKINKNLDLTFHTWLPINGFIGKDTYFINSSPYTTLTSPSNAFIPVTTTAYNISDNSLYVNASRGFTRTGQISPDFAASGVNMIGPSPGNGYTKYSGTSVAAAHTAGVAAMLFEWGKVRGNIEYMDGSDIKNLLIRGARRSPKISYPSREWGYGILDIYGAFESLRGI